MTKEELVDKLREYQMEKYDDFETGHIRADELLLEYINDSDIKQAYENVGRWYS